MDTQTLVKAMNIKICILALVLSLRGAASDTNTVPWNHRPVAHPSAPSKQLILSNRYDEALTDIYARLKDDEDGALFANLSVVQLARGNRAEALKASRNAVRLGQVDHLPLLVLLLIEEGKQCDAACLVPSLSQLSMLPTVSERTRVEAISILITYRIAQAKEAEALNLVKRLQDVPRWQEHLLYSECGKLLEQAKQRGFSAMVTQLQQAIQEVRTGQGPQAVADNASNRRIESDGFTTNVSECHNVPCDPAASMSISPEAIEDMHEELKLASEGKLKEAAKMAEKVVAQRPKFARAWRFLGTCYDALGDSFKSFQCTSNAVVLGDAYAVINMAVFAAETDDIHLWKSLQEQLGTVASDRQCAYLSGRLEAHYMHFKLAERLGDKKLLKRLSDDLPIAAESDEFHVAQLRRFETILGEIVAVCVRNAIEVDNEIIRRARRAAAVAASSSKMIREH